MGWMPRMQFILLKIHVVPTAAPRRAWFQGFQLALAAFPLKSPLNPTNGGLRSNRIVRFIKRAAGLGQVSSGDGQARMILI